MPASIDNFKEEKECIYKREQYSVRDNGAVLRHFRQGKRMRAEDNTWTFGKPDPRMYLKIGSESVHRIVATAFHGEPPSQQHVVDHIDTNRQNNRPENLRWLTKLENILNNPITLKRIKYRCGSIEAFLENPSIIGDYLSDDPSFSWMRTVSAEEAQASWERLSKWAQKGSAAVPSTQFFRREWIPDNIVKTRPPINELGFYPSLTTNAVQKEWKTPTEFPCCPKEFTSTPIEDYAKNLKTGEVFSRNSYVESIVLDIAVLIDRKMIWIMSKSNEDNIKPWLLAKVTYENLLFVHESLGSFFTEIGAKKQFHLVQGLEWHGEDSIDDFC